jgi:hypothetical protein
MPMLGGTDPEPGFQTVFEISDYDACHQLRPFEIDAIIGER